MMVYCHGRLVRMAEYRLVDRSQPYHHGNFTRYRRVSIWRCMGCGRRLRPVS